MFSLHATLATLWGLILAIIATIVCYLAVLPPQKRESLHGFPLWLHDLLHFKLSYVEKILQFFYIFLSCSAFFVGFFLLFSRSGYGNSLLRGLCMMIITPVFLRVVYEILILFVHALQNVDEINKKLDAPCIQEQPEEQQPEPHFLYCTQCGTRYDANQGDCTNCGLR